MTTIATMSQPATSSPFRRLIIRHPLVVFFVIAFAGAWLAWLPLVLAQNGLGLLPYTIPEIGLVPLSYWIAIPASVLGLSLASLTVTAVTAGKAGVRQLLQRYVLWRVGIRWYLLVLVGVPLIQLVCSSVFLGTAPLTAFIRQWPLFFTTFLPNVLIIGVAVQIWEEGGWSGFAIPNLQQRFGAWRACLVIGPLWALWHLPAFFVPGQIFDQKVDAITMVVQMVQEQQEQVRERERIEQELRTAQAIQHAFLPKDVPTLPGWQFAPYYRPAREVGGDFYDFLPFADGRLGLVIGDVTGKGIPAALVMATVQTMLRTAVQGMSAPGEVLMRVNDLLAADLPAGMFVTCFFALLDPTSGQLHYANAGQDLPYRCHSEGVSELWATGMPLGMLPGSRYEEHEVTIAPGESLLFYSDGLVEAHNPAREIFDTPRLKALLAEHADGASLIEVLLGELKRFTGEGWEQEDDVTLLTLQRTAASLV